MSGYRFAGDEGMLALGIANMMIKEGLYNKEFISNHTFGFENWTDSNGKEHLGFRDGPFRIRARSRLQTNRCSH